MVIGLVIVTDAIVINSSTICTVHYVCIYTQLYSIVTNDEGQQSNLDSIALYTLYSISKYIHIMEFLNDLKAAK